MYSFTHAIVGICLSILLVLEMPFVIVGALISDTDYLFGVEHRGAFHSLIFGIAIFLILYYKSGKRPSFSFMIGYLSHLALDSLTPMGISLLWPLAYNFSFNIAPSSDAVVNLGIIIISGILIFNKDYIMDLLSHIPPKRVQKSTFGFFGLFFLVLLIFGTKSVQGCEGVYVLMEDLLSNQDFYDGQEMITNGTICSDIRSYRSSAGNFYQIFDLCSGNYSIVVWKLQAVQSSDISENDNVNICGTFTLEYTDPEINYIKYVTANG
jgi:inner membrane protein